MKPQDPRPWYFLALIHEQKGELAKAHQEVTRALELAPQSSPYRAEIEALRHRLGVLLGSEGT
jgi:Flp pilus assembly protein TadD